MTAIDASPNTAALSRNIPNSAPEFWLNDEPDPVADDVDDLARRPTLATSQALASWSSTRTRAARPKNTIQCAPRLVAAAAAGVASTLGGSPTSSIAMR